MKIHFDSQHEMEEAASMYGKSKEVVVLGEHKKDRWLNEEPEPKKEKKKKEAAEAKAKLKLEKAEKKEKAAPVKDVKKKK